MNNMNINSAIADTLDIGNTDTEKKTGLIGFYNYTDSAYIHRHVDRLPWSYACHKG